MYKCRPDYEYATAEDTIIQIPNHEGGYFYRAERHKITDEYTTYICGIARNVCVEDYSVVGLRCKLYTRSNEKVLFIMDVCGFDYTWGCIRDFMNCATSLIDISPRHIEILIDSIKKMYTGWDIRVYDEDTMATFQLTRKIFHNINYPYDLENHLVTDVVQHIHEYNSHKYPDFSDSKWHYNKDKAQTLWDECKATHSDYGILNIWFGFDSDYEIFDITNIKNKLCIMNLNQEL